MDSPDRVGLPSNEKPAIILPSIHITDMPAGSICNETIHEDELEEEVFRPRSSTFSGCNTSKKMQREKTDISELSRSMDGVNMRGNSIALSSPRRKFQKAATLALIQDKVGKPSPVSFARRGSVLFGDMAPGITDATTDQDAANRRMSMASVVGLVLFKKMYNAELDAHVKKQLQYSQSQIGSSENWESSDSEADEEETDDTETRAGKLSRARAHRRVRLSTEGQLAMLRCYDEKIKSGLVKQYPRYKNALYRTQTPACRPRLVPAAQKAVPGRPTIPGKPTLPSRAALPDKQAAPIDKYFQLKRAGILLDALKAEKGEVITTPRYLSTQGSKTRPKSKRLVKKYNTWTNSWARREANNCLWITSAEWNG